MNQKRFIVIVDETFIRDAQVYTGTEDAVASEETDYYSSDDWGDITEPVYLGLYEGDTPQDAIRKAAEKNMLPEFILAAEECGAERYVLSTTDGFSIETTDHPTKGAAQEAMKASYEQLIPEEWDEDCRNMSYCGDMHAVLYDNYENVYVWDISMVQL